MRVAQERGRRVSDGSRCDANGIQHDSDAELFASLRVRELVGAHREHDQRQTVRERADHAAGSTVVDHEVAVGEQERLRDVALDVHVVGLRAEPFRIETPPDGDDNGRRQLAESCEHAIEEIAGLLVEDRPEREVDGGSFRQV